MTRSKRGFALPPGLSALAAPDLRRLLVAALTYRSGFWMSTVVFQTHLAAIAGADALSLGVLGFCNLAPIIPLAPVGGLLADRFSRRKIIVASQVCMAIVAGGLAILVWGGRASSVTLLYLFAAAFGVGMAINGPSFQALTANVVPTKDLAGAVSLAAVVTNLTRLAGPALGGILVSLSGVAAGFAAYGLATLASALVCLRIETRGGGVGAGDDSRGFLSGLRYAVASPTILASLALVSLGALFGSSLVLLMAAFAAEAFGTSGVEFVWLTTAVGAGAIAGAGLVTRRSHRPTLSAAAAWSGAFGMALSLLGLAPNLPVAFALCFLLGVLSFYAVTALQVVLQAHTSDNMRGRVMGLFMICWAGLMPVGALILGFLGRWVGMRTAVILGGVIVITSSWLIPRLGGGEQ